MPITFNLIGTIMDVSVIDTNFELWQNIFRSGILGADILNKIKRWRVKRYVSGRIVSVDSFINPYRGEGPELISSELNRLDITYKEGTEDCGIALNARQRENEPGSYAYEMELLGKPGKSFYYNWQEDGISETIYLTGIAGWPPAGYPFERHPTNLCFSKWLTAPGASTKIYVPYPCIARIHGKVKGSFSFWNTIRNLVYPGPPGIPDVAYQHIHFDSVPVRTGLIVDTNPIRYLDEFTNTNCNVVESNGVMAPACSWKIVKDHTWFTSQRDTINLWAEVPLIGGREYNFSMKYRDPLHYGYVAHTKTTHTWINDFWENSTPGSYANAPIISTYSTGNATKLHPLFINLFDSCSISVEFSYGRNQAYIHDTGHAQFQGKP